MTVRILVWQAQHEFGKRLEHCLGQFPLPTELAGYDEEVLHPSDGNPLEGFDMAFISTTALREYDQQHLAWSRIAGIPIIWIGSGNQNLYSRRSASDSVVLPAYFNCSSLHTALRQILRLPDLDETEQALQSASQAARVSSLEGPDGSEFIYSAPVMQQLVANAQLYGRLSMSVLIRGASGTGKEHIARMVAQAHPSFGKGPFIPVNCAAIPDTLFESLFFGHRKGSFTGAIRDHRGFFQEAQGGTLYLDEIGDLPRFQQVKLLRALEDGVIHPVGSNEAIQIHFRLIAATNRPLLQMIDEGSFRLDFYHRIGVIELYIPNLEERGPAEKLLLFRHAFAQAIDKFGAHLHVDTPELPLWLQKWVTRTVFPGNVRELANKAARMAAYYLGHRRLEESECRCLLDIQDPDTEAEEEEGNDMGLLDYSARREEREQIVEALEKAHWRRSEAAEMLGWSRKTLWLKMKKYSLSE